MNKSIFVLLAAAFIYSCSDHDHNSIEPAPSHPDLVSPELDDATNVTTKSPFTGSLELYPCSEGSSIYFGNYYNNILTAIYPMYAVNNGTGSVSTRPLLLPIGTYNIIYWGMPKETEDIYTDMSIKEPPLRLNADMSQIYYSLRKHPNVKDTIYYPVFNYVHAVVPTNIGTDKLSASLQRVVAGINVTISGKDGGEFDTNVESVQVLVGNIAEKLDVFSATPSNQTKTVQFPLTLSADGKQMSVPTVMLFPSAPNPPIQIIITLKNGAVKTYKQNLTTTLNANTKLSLSMTLNEIFSSESTTGDFNVSDWNEKNESIDLPPIGG